MEFKTYRSIDMAATGRNIAELRRSHGYSVTDLQRYFGFEAPQAIYKWQRGESIPSTDNLYALSYLLGVPMEEILVPLEFTPCCEESQDNACDFFLQKIHPELQRLQSSPFRSLCCFFPATPLTSFRFFCI